MRSNVDTVGHTVSSDSRRLLGASLLGLAMLGGVVVLSFPAARAAEGALGWPPMWWVGAPLVGWLALQLRQWCEQHRQRPAPVPSAMRRRQRAQAVHRPSARRRTRSRMRAVIAAAAWWSSAG